MVCSHALRSKLDVIFTVTPHLYIICILLLFRSAKVRNGNISLLRGEDGDYIYCGDNLISSTTKAASKATVDTLIYTSTSTTSSPIILPLSHNETHHDISTKRNQCQYSSWKTFKIALVVAPNWFLANFLYNASLTYTSVASNTIISSTSR